MVSYVNVCMRNRTPHIKTNTLSTYPGWYRGNAKYNTLPNPPSVQQVVEYWPINKIKALAQGLVFRTPEKTDITCNVRGGFGGFGGVFTYIQLRSGGSGIVSVTVSPGVLGGYPPLSTYSGKIGRAQNLYIVAGGCGVGGVNADYSSQFAPPLTPPAGSPGGAGSFSAVYYNNYPGKTASPAFHNQSGSIARSYGGGGGDMGYYGLALASDGYAKNLPVPPSPADWTLCGKTVYSLVMFF